MAAAAAAHAHAHLDYFQTSPVRGQLEPAADDGTRSGWRWIQCTDTPNQLRVLLPPSTAKMYARLLALEAGELDKGAQAHWTRIMEIRHLKDRMVRKCQRLALPNQHAQAADATFRTVTAPADFRLKEMERYLKGQDPKPRKARAPAAPESPPPSINLHPFSPPSLSPTSPAGHHAPLPPRSPSPYEQLPYVPAADFAPIYAPPPLDSGGPRGDGGDDGPYDDDDFGNEPLVMALSPEPLPVPYRGSRALSPLHEHPAEGGGFGPTFADLGPPPPGADDAPSPLPLTEPPEPGPGMPEPELGDLPPEQRPIPRRRSSLKRKDSGLSAHGSARGISWALDLPRAELVRRDVELAANDLNELREAYRAQLAAIRDEREGIAEALRQLHLKEDALRHREDELHHTHQQLEGKELHYRNKVLAALEETKRGLQASGQA